MQVKLPYGRGMQVELPYGREMQVELPDRGKGRLLAGPPPIIGMWKKKCF